jgi:hypothetical protein
MVVRPKTAQHHTGERACRVDLSSNVAPLSEEVFLNALCFERRRAERARRRFILALLDIRGLRQNGHFIPA